jgi:chorismate mutase
MNSIWVERRIAELSEEIRHYPGPIARCDEHLPALLEERARLMAQLGQQSCSAEALWTNDGGFNAA